MNKYEVDIKKLALLLLPTFMRKPLIAGITYASVSGLSNIYMRFARFREETNYRLEHNGQVCHLRAVLNDYFDPFERRITVTENAELYDNSSIYMREVNTNEAVRIQDTEDYALTVNRRGFTGIHGFDFWVNLPAAAYKEIDVKRVEAIVNIYKLASKRYGISYK
ncbi:MAG: hypothetical protein LUF04_16150 [Bacteroides sp.]|nr:hypothetical protein [Bacteroides sp.]